MIRAQIAYLNRKDVPARNSLQAAIHQLGFKVALDDSYEPFETSGYLPCTLDGEDAGFDLRFKDVAADLSSTPALQSSMGDRDTAVSCRWGGDPREEVSALIVCAALVRNCDALVQQGDGDALLSFE